MVDGLREYAFLPAQRAGTRKRKNFVDTRVDKRQRIHHRKVDALTLIHDFLSTYLSTLAWTFEYQRDIGIGYPSIVGVSIDR